MFAFHDKRKYSLISIAHYQKLIMRVMLFLLAIAIWGYGMVTGTLDEVVTSPVAIIVSIFVAAVFVVEMISRLVPSPIESIGCEKQFGANLDRTDVPEPMLQSGEKTAWVIVSWVVLNGIIGALYLSGLCQPFLNTATMYLLCLVYSICDMVCILFFCPFQTWMMGNKCCGTCRIYNWDYAMMFTPLVFVPSLPSYAVLGMALIVLGVWEYRYRAHPERFSEATNASLSCANCQEKLCRHKHQLSRYLDRNREEIQQRGEMLSAKLRAEIAERQRAAAEVIEKKKEQIGKVISDRTRDDSDGDPE